MTSTMLVTQHIIEKNMSKKISKEKVLLKGGPYDGYHAFLESSSTFKFEAGGYLGLYLRLGWREEAVWEGINIAKISEINENIILSNTE